MIEEKTEEVYLKKLIRTYKVDRPVLIYNTISGQAKPAFTVKLNERNVKEMVHDYLIYNKEKLEEIVSRGYFIVNIGSYNFTSYEYVADATVYSRIAYLSGFMNTALFRQHMLGVDILGGVGGIIIDKNLNEKKVISLIRQKKKKILKQKKKIESLSWIESGEKERQKNIFESYKTELNNLCRFYSLMG